MPTEPTDNHLSAAACIARARFYHAEIRQLADLMERDEAGMSNRGRWNEAIWLLRKDACDKLAMFIGEKTLSEADS